MNVRPVPAGYHLNLKRKGQAKKGAGVISVQRTMKRVASFGGVGVVERIGSQDRPATPLPDDELKIEFEKVLERAFGKVRCWGQLEEGMPLALPIYLCYTLAVLEAALDHSRPL